MIKERIIKGKVNPKLNQGCIYRVTKSSRNHTIFKEGVYFVATLGEGDSITTLRSESNKDSTYCDYTYFNNLDLEYVEVTLQEVDE